MAVYVDISAQHARGRNWCHLRADTLFELHDFAIRLGLRKDWFHDRQTSHYDMPFSKVKLAQSMGAKDSTREAQPA